MKNRVNWEEIPKELFDKIIWLAWGYQEREGNKTKVPFDAKAVKDGLEPRFCLGSCTDPSTWSDFETAYDVGLDGVGISIVPPYCGIDIDHCVNDGVIDPVAQSYINRLSSYTELSPSGKGIRILIKGKKPGGRCRVGNTEIYDSARFVTITGNHIDGTPLTINERQQELNIIYEELFPPEPVKVRTEYKKPPVSLADEELISLAASYSDKFKALYEGDYKFIPLKADGITPDYSVADTSFCCCLARLTRDAEQIKRIYESSALDNNSWERLADTRIEDAFDFVPLDEKLLFDYLESKVEQVIKEAPNVDQAEPQRRLCTVDEFFSLTNSNFSWLVSDMLPFGKLHILGGPPKHGKTTFILQQAFQLMATQPISVLFLDFENPSDYFKEFIFEKYVSNNQDLRNKLKKNFSISSREIEVAHLKLPNFIDIDYIDLIVKSYNKPVWVIIDSLRRAFNRTLIHGKALPPQWERSEDVISTLLDPFVEYCHLKKNVNVSIIHHDNKAGVLSGSTDISGIVDCIWHFRREFTQLGERTNIAKIQMEGRGIPEEPLFYNFVDGCYKFIGNTNNMAETNDLKVINLFPSEAIRATKADAVYTRADCQWVRTQWTSIKSFNNKLSELAKETKLGCIKQGTGLANLYYQL